MDQKSVLPELREQLGRILSSGMAAEPLAHAGQVTEIAGVLYQAFKSVGLHCTLVGGSAIEVHAPGIYKSGDMDLVIEGPRKDLRKRINDVFVALGFMPQGKHWSCGDLFVEVPGHRIEDPTETVKAGKSVFAIVTKEVVLADRIVGFMQWRFTAYAQQAVDMLAAFGDQLEMAWLEPKLEKEGSRKAFVALLELAKNKEPLTEHTLQELLVQLHRRA